MTNESFSERLAKARASIGWSQAELSSAAGISATQISRYESGVSAPRTSAVGKLANALNVEYEWLLSGKGTPERGGANEPLAPKGWKVMTIELSQEEQSALLAVAEKYGVTVEAAIGLLSRRAMLERIDQLADGKGAATADLEKRLARIEKAVGLEPEK